MDRLPPLINKMVGEPFLLIKGGFLHNAKAILTTRRAGGLFVLQSSVFRINEKLLNGEQGPALTIKKNPARRILRLRRVALATLFHSAAVRSRGAFFVS